MKPNRSILCHVILSLCVMVAFISCSSPLEEQVEQALRLAGSNRGELEKVLRHYENQPSKLEAARFLIGNMPLHHFYQGWELDSMKAILKKNHDAKKPEEALIKRFKGFNYRRSLSMVQDVQVVKSDMLIDNIELAFEAWERRPWSKRYTFADFCEYVLPYRVGDEPVENWRRTYYERYAPVLDSLYRGSDVMEAARVMAKYLKAEGFRRRDDIKMPHWGAMFLLDVRGGYCRETCDVTTYVMRALGIPVTTDFYEMSPCYNSRHFWNALLDTTGLALPFSYTERREVSRRPVASEEASARKKGKVYRLCYGVQPEKYERMYADAAVPAFFKNCLLKDASLEYFPDTEVKADVISDTGDWAYLCVFTGREFQPIDIACRRGGTAVFRGVEPELIYFPTCRKGNEMLPSDYPLMPLENGIKHFVPDTLHREDVTVCRKYPMRETRKFLGRSVGVKVELANRKNFADGVLLHHVVDTPIVNYNVFRPVSEGRQFRYVRYAAPSDKRPEIGGWYMFSKGNSQPLKPVGIEANPPLDSLRRSLLPLLDDDDWSSYYHSDFKGEQLIFDLGRPVVLDHILFIPRTDDNFVHPGDVYELFYHVGASGWKSLGRQRATGTELHYKGVPRNAILWLHNHTRGKEERCFYMENGKQVFM